MRKSGRVKTRVCRGEKPSKTGVHHGWWGGNPIRREPTGSLAGEGGKKAYLSTLFGYDPGWRSSVAIGGGHELGSQLLDPQLEDVAQGNGKRGTNFNSRRDNHHGLSMQERYSAVEDTKALREERNSTTK